MIDFWVFAIKHAPLFSILASLAIAVVIVEVLRGKRNLVQIDTTTAVRWLNHQNAILFDVRDSNQFNQAHIIGAISLPHASRELLEKRMQKSKGKPIILVSDAGAELLKTLKLTQLLGEGGYTAKLLKGGMPAWISQNLPVIKEGTS